MAFSFEKLWIITALLGAALLAVGLCVRSIRRVIRTGRRGSAPVCDACDYEIGVAPERGVRCSECGAALDRPGAVAIGHRAVYRRRLILPGLLLAVSTLAAIVAGTAFTMALPSALVHAKPTSWLIQDLRALAARGRFFGVPVDVMAKRVEEDRLTAEQWQALIEAIWPALSGRGSWSNALTDALRAKLGAPDASLPSARMAFEALMSELEGNPGADCPTLEDDLAALLKRADLPAERRDRLIELVILRQGARHAPSRGRSGWHRTPLAHAFGREAGRGRVSTEHLRRYFEATIAPTLTLNDGKSLHAGSTVRVDMDLCLPLSVIGTRFAYRVHLRGDCASWPTAGQDIDPAVMRHDSLSGCGPSWWMTLPESPGEHKVNAELELMIYELEEHGSMGVVAATYADPTRLGDLASPRLRVVEPCSVSITTLPAAALSPVRMVSDPEPEEVVKNRRVYAGIFGWKCQAADLVHVDFSSLLAPPPVTVPADVFVRQNGTEKRIGWVLAPAGTEWNTGVSAAGTGLRGGRCEFILRPNAGIVRDGAGVGPIYGREIRIEGSLWSPSAKEWDGAYYNWGD